MVQKFAQLPFDKNISVIILINKYWLPYYIRIIDRISHFIFLFICYVHELHFPSVTFGGKNILAEGILSDRGETTKTLYVLCVFMKV